MKLHILVEGPSEKAFLENWLPRFLPHGHTFKIYPHRGKGKIPGNTSAKPDTKRQGILDQLPAKLRAFGRILNPETERVIVLVDLDNDDCILLKNRMNELLSYCDPPPVVMFRIAIEETEAFYMGDSKAVRRSFPKANLQKLRSYKQDSICNTWEKFQDVIGEKSEDKVGWGRKMGLSLTTEWKGKNAGKSPSFRCFCKALLKLAGEEVD